MYIHVMYMCSCCWSQKLLSSVWTTLSQVTCTCMSVTYRSLCVSVEYGYGSLAVLVICLAALPGICLLQSCARRHSSVQRLVMSFMVGLAIGSLFADAFLHLIPAVSTPGVRG